MESPTNNLLEGLRDELGNPNAKPEDILRHYVEEGFKELATKLGISPSDFDMTKLWLSLNGNNQYPQCNTASYLEVLAAWSLTEKAVLARDKDTNEPLLTENNGQRASRTLKFYCLEKIRHVLEERLSLPKISDDMSYGMQGDNTWQKTVKKFLDALQ